MKLLNMWYTLTLFQHGDLDFKSFDKKCGAFFTAIIMLNCSQLLKNFLRLNGIAKRYN